MLQRIEIAEAVHKHIFLIDDEPLVLDAYCSILRDAGFRNLHTFTSAVDAINMLRCIRPDMILTDIHMPGVTGIVFTGLVREFEHLDSIPIIAITADDRIGTAQEVLRRGAHATLMKPVAADELIGHICSIPFSSQACRS